MTGPDGMSYTVETISPPAKARVAITYPAINFLLSGILTVPRAGIIRLANTRYTPISCTDSVTVIGNTRKNSERFLNHIASNRA